jgi:hypothetical protein
MILLKISLPANLLINTQLFELQLANYLAANLIFPMMRKVSLTVFFQQRGCLKNLSTLKINTMITRLCPYVM